MLPTIAHPRRHAVVASILALACAVMVPEAFAQTERTDVVDDPFARRSWTLQLSSHVAVETWNYNISHEEMYGISAGFTYGIRDGLVLTAGGTLYNVDQRGVDAWVVGATAGVRGRIFRKGPVSAFWEVEIGVAEADTYTPPRGTRFNYLALGSGGVTVELRRGVHLLGAMQWIHVSNNGLAGRDRNPDIEAVGPRLGILLGF